MHGRNWRELRSKLMSTAEALPAHAAAVLGSLPLHARMRAVWALRYGTLYSILLLPPFVVAVTLLDLAPFFVGAALALACGMTLGWLYARRYARAFSAAHLVDGMLIRRGVWWRGEMFVPRARIQHTEINQGPLDRRWDMASVAIHTAGTRLESIVVPGLPRALAESLRDALLDRKLHADGA